MNRHIARSAPARRKRDHDPNSKPGHRLRRWFSRVVVSSIGVTLG